MDVERSQDANPSEGWLGGHVLAWDHHHNLRDSAHRQILGGKQLLGGRRVRHCGSLRCTDREQYDVLQLLPYETPSTTYGQRICQSQRLVKRRWEDS